MKDVTNSADDTLDLAPPKTQAKSKALRVRKWEKAFLSTLAECGVVTRALAAADVDVACAYRYRYDSETFAAAWDAALDEFADSLEREAIRRAREGYDEAVFGRLPGQYAGEGQIGVVHKYSDPLMIKLLGAYRPEKYREKRDITLTGNIKLNDISGLTDDELRAIIASQSGGGA
jgi:hypothetical protein